jgi:peptidoglycan/xylan/chitin deacetylase (PgdA/CDA1 family)
MKTIYTCFPGGRNKALSLSYDDGRTADRRLVEILNKAGIKGTFHLNSGFLGREGYVRADEVASLYRGHEVASHTCTHPMLERIPREEVVRQVLEDRRRLEELVGYTVRGFSYPYGNRKGEIAALLPSLGIEYARLVQTTGDFQLSDDLFAWKTTCHHTDDLLGLSRRFLDISGRQSLNWFSVWGHSFEFEKDDSWDLIERFSAMIGGKTDIWYATVIETVDYLKAAKAVRVAASGDFAENPTARPVWLAADGSVVEVPAGGSVRLGD